MFKEGLDLLRDQIDDLPVTYSVNMAPNVMPVVNPLRRILVAMQKSETSSRKRKLLVCLNLWMSPQNRSPTWLPHKKETDNVPICIDPRDLNKALMRPHRPMHMVEEGDAQMSGATVFSVHNAKSSFWQINLD